MSFAEAVARQQDAVFRRLGEDATWSGVADPVRIRVAEKDEEASWRESQAVVRVRYLKVRQSEVSAPVAGQVLVRTKTAESLRVIETPTLDRKGVWLCKVVPHV